VSPSQDSSTGLLAPTEGLLLEEAIEDEEPMVHSSPLSMPKLAGWKSSSAKSVRPYAWLSLASPTST